MSEQSDGQEKDLEASEKRIQQSREDGKVPRSRDLAGGLIGLGSIGLLWATSDLIWDQLRTLFNTGMALDSHSMRDPSQMYVMLFEQVKIAMLMMTPLFIVVVVFSLLGHMAIGGAIWSNKKLEPDFSKLNVFKGIKNIFSLNSAVELIKSILKLLLLATVGYFLVKNQLDEILAMSRTSLESAVMMAIDLFLLSAFTLTFAYMLIPLFDAPYQIWQHYKGLRMSMEEMKREMKESDGDPIVKGKIREAQRRMSQNRMMKNIPKADVVVTNPTHYSVAIKYTGEDGPPRVVAKGKGEIALQIRAIARENNIPIVEMPPLARALYAHVKVDRHISAEFFDVVAKVLAFVFQANQSQYAGSQMPTEDEVPKGFDPGPDE